MREVDPTRPALLDSEASPAAPDSGGRETERTRRDREKAIHELRLELARSSGDLARATRHNEAISRELAEITQALHSITGSRAYPLLLRLWGIHRSLAPEGTERERRLALLLDAAGLERRPLAPAPVEEQARPARPAPHPPQDPYEAWLEVNRWTDRARAHLESRLANRDLPRISVVMPIFDPPSAELDAAIESVRAQVYGDWELCIADDASRRGATRRAIETRARRDPRIRIAPRPSGRDIGTATNTAAALATGELLVFLVHGDALTPDALGELALLLADEPDTDVVYSDEDRIGLDGKRGAPTLKPGWSPELLLSFMYLGHLWGLRRHLFHEVGGFRDALPGSQDHDLALRATERARRVSHVPLVLYHARAVAGSIAGCMAVAGSGPPDSFAVGRGAVEDALARRGVPARVERPPWAVSGDLALFEPQFPDEGPPVAVLVPSRNRADLLRPCLAALRATSYRNARVVVVDDESDDPTTLAFLCGLKEEVLLLAREDGGSNLAALFNRAARATTDEYVLFLDDDTRVLHPRWLSQMMGYAQLPGVGAVGARLLYANGRIQHAGVVHGMHHGLAGYAFSHWPAEDHGYLFGARAARNCSAVSAACLLTPRRLFLDQGGFDEAAFPMAYHDADYGYRLRRAGLRAVYCPSAELVRLEGASRGFVDDPRARAAYRRRYAGLRDPVYSPHLSLEDGTCQIVPRRVFRGGRGPMRALLWTHALDWTGAPLQQLEVVTALQEKGVLRAEVMSAAGGPLDARYREAGIDVEVRPIALTDVTEEAYDLAVSALAAALRERAPDVVYVNTLDGFAAVDAANRAGIPSLWNIHESDPWESYFQGLGPALEARALATFSMPYRVVFVSEASRRAFSALDVKGRFCVVPNGLSVRVRHTPLLTRPEARETLGIEPQDIVFLLVGTVCARKGQHDLVGALAALGDTEAEHVRCILVGDREGSYSRELAHLTDVLPARRRSRVWRIPETPDTERYYRAADVFVCTSRLESYPRVILEAMAHGLPIVTTPVFGIREQVREDVNALFYPPGDVYALADALARLATDPALRQRLASRSQDILASLPGFSEMIEAYGEMLSEASLTTPAH